MRLVFRLAGIAGEEREEVEAFGGFRQVEQVLFLLAGDVQEQAPEQGVGIGRLRALEIEELQQESELAAAVVIASPLEERLERIGAFLRGRHDLIVKLAHGLFLREVVLLHQSARNDSE